MLSRQIFREHALVAVMDRRMLRVADLDRRLRPSSNAVLASTNKTRKAPIMLPFNRIKASLVLAGAAAALTLSTFARAETIDICAGHTYETPCSVKSTYPASVTFGGCGFWPGFTSPGDYVEVYVCAQVYGYWECGANPGWSGYAGSIGKSGYPPPDWCGGAISGTINLPCLSDDGPVGLYAYDVTTGQSTPVEEAGVNSCGH